MKIRFTVISLTVGLTLGLSPATAQQFGGASPAAPPAAPPTSDSSHSDSPGLGSAPDRSAPDSSAPDSSAPDIVPSDEQNPDVTPDPERVRLDRNALRQMTRSERRAALRAYKQAREGEARAAGIKVSSDRQFVRLDPPRRTFGPGTVDELQVPGTQIRYDSGAVIGSGGVPGHTVGNIFDHARNPSWNRCCFPVASSGSVTMITFDMINTRSNVAIWSLYSNVMGTSAVQITSQSVSVKLGLNTVNVMSPTTANVYANGPFLAGIWQFDTKSTALGLDTHSIGGQGFHGASINDGNVGTQLTPFTTGGGQGVNAVFRVNGSIGTPVELQSFSIR